MRFSDTCWGARPNCFCRKSETSGVQLPECAALQAKALLVKAQAQAQADLYTKEQQVRASNNHVLVALPG